MHPNVLKLPGGDRTKQNNFAGGTGQRAARSNPVGHIRGELVPKSARGRRRAAAEEAKGQQERAAVQKQGARRVGQSRTPRTRTGAGRRTAKATMATAGESGDGDERTISSRLNSMRVHPPPCD